VTAISSTIENFDQHIIHIGQKKTSSLVTQKKNNNDSRIILMIIKFFYCLLSAWALGVLH